tara:strand:- start:5762 stop:6208 length:447 start_codon:yes stop_codon:yes gene_type:complete
MADEILKGALTDPAIGNQASMLAMDPNDRLLEMSDTQRMAFLKSTAGVEVEEIKEGRIVEQTHSTPPTTMELTPKELETLSEAKRIITKIQEATTVGSIGVNFAGGGKSADPKAVTVPGDVNVAGSPKKRVKKKAKTKTNDFLHYINR